MPEKYISNRFSQQVVRDLKSQIIHVEKTNKLGKFDSMSGDHLDITMTLCPLYELGSLSGSRLLLPQPDLSSTEVIERSRVSVKWRTGIAALRSIQKTASRSKFKYSISALIAFADRGVITGNPEQESPQVLLAHERIYRAALQETLGDIMDFRFFRYSDIAPDFPQFVIDTDAQPVSRTDDRQVEIDRAANLINRLVQSGMSINQEVSKRRVAELIQQIGSVSLTEALMRQYATFDARTTQVNAINLFIERRPASLLLQVTDLFPHGQHPRIDILC